MYILPKDNKSDDKLLKQTLAEEARLNRYNRQLADITEKIRHTEERLVQLKTERITNVYNAAESIFSIKGLTFTEVMSAVEHGNLLELQEKIESQSQEITGGKKETDAIKEADATKETDAQKETDTNADIADEEAPARPHGEDKGGGRQI